MTVSMRRPRNTLPQGTGCIRIDTHVNKMDISGVDWSEDKYKSACSEVTQLLKIAGFAVN